MSVYIKNIVMALIAFPFAAFIFTLPYAIIQYRKYGGIPFMKVLVVYSMILYFICAYFMIILPLPSIEEVSQMTSPTVQLIPFSFVTDIMSKSGLVLNDPSTYLSSVKSSSVLVVAFNILLFVPLGIYLRYYYNAKWRHILIASFVISLFFELTQLSGLYGIYPRAYRLFDVDDLMMNVLGGVLGFLIAPLFMKILPSRERLDDLSYLKGSRVTLTRRSVGAFIDWFCVCLIGGVVSAVCTLFNSDDIITLAGSSVSIGIVLGLICVFFVIPILTKGYTPGKFLVGLRLYSDKGAPKPFDYIKRYGLLYFILLPSFFWGMFLSNLSGETGYGVFGVLSFIVLLASVYIYIRLAVEFIKTGAKKQSCFLYEKQSGIYNVSVVKKPQVNKEVS